MKNSILSFVFLFSSLYSAYAQDLYFPPLIGSTWDTLSMTELGWCPENLPALYDYLDDKNTKAFIVLKDGKIVLEKYYDTFTKDSLWYWASAGKCITSVLTGIAQQEGFLSIEDNSATYLGSGWTSMTPSEENAIKIKHQLTMTTGLNYDVADIFCTDPACLTYGVDPGEQWYYHNAPYTLLDGVISNASGMSLNAFCNTRLESATGMSGLFVPVDYNNVYFSKPRDMARFGLMILNEGYWNGTGVLTDAAYYNAMINTSQSLNLSYGYLWWLNGKSSFMLPSSTMVFDGSAMPNAPDDMISALGKNGQILNIVPSQNLIVVRMGNSPDGIEALVPTIFNNTIWDYLNQLMCESSSLAEELPNTPLLYPNPASGAVYIDNDRYDRLVVMNAMGQIVYEGNLDTGKQHIDIHYLSAGIYYVFLGNKDGMVREKLIVN